MWPFSSSKPRSAFTAARRRHSTRLYVEALEDRCLLSAGALDPTFGNGAGYVTTSTSNYTDVGATALIQPNDIIAAGRAGTSSSNSEFGVVRYNPNGSLDTTFGSGGIALANFGSVPARGPSTVLYPQAGMATDGDILQAGSNGSQFLMARYTPNGSLDTSFGTGGEVESSFSGMSAIQHGSVVLTSTGQIMAYADDATAHFALARYNSNGTLDTTFGHGGYVITSITAAGENSQFPTLLPQPNGQLIVVTSQSGTTWDLLRFNADGTLDTTFGNQGTGIVTTSIGGPMSSAVLYPSVGTADDGKILLLGQSATGAWELARYNTNGILDSTFGTGGEVQTQIITGPPEVGGRVTLDANDRIIAAGGTAGRTATLLARFNDNGTLDPTFGSSGLVTTAFGTSSYFFGVTVYPNAGPANDGDIVAVGESVNSTGKENVLVARYLGDSPSFSVSGFPTSITAGVAGAFTVTARNADGSTNTSYLGTVHFTCSDPHAVLPADYTFTAADQGVHTFSTTLVRAGSQSITATDAVTSTTFGSDAGITVNPAAASTFVISGFPTSITQGTAVTFTVTAMDPYGNVATGYTGTVHFTSSDPKAVLPAIYTFTAADAGVHTFSAIFNTVGTESLTVADILNSLITGIDTDIVVKKKK